MFGREKKANAAEKKEWEHFEDHSSGDDASIASNPPPPPPLPIKFRPQGNEPKPFDEPAEQRVISDVENSVFEEKKEDHVRFDPVQMAIPTPAPATTNDTETARVEEKNKVFPDAGVPDRNQEGDVVQEKEKKGSNWTIIIAAVIIGLCLLIGLAIGLGLQGSESDENENEIRVVTTEPPSSAPTEDAFVCTKFIEPEFDCYGTGPNFVSIAFEMCDDALGEDYVGIYDYSDELDPEDLGNPILWIWSCGRSNLDQCDTPDVAVKNETDLTLGGVLREGMYQVHLSHRNPGGPYRSEVASAPFVVSENC